VRTTTSGIISLPEDYRLGPKWYLFDIGKWFIELCAWLRLARGLRTVTEAAVLIRARKLKLALGSQSAGEFEAQE